MEHLESLFTIEEVSKRHLSNLEVRQMAGLEALVTEGVVDWTPAEVGAMVWAGMAWGGGVGIVG